MNEWPNREPSIVKKDWLIHRFDERYIEESRPRVSAGSWYSIGAGSRLV